MGPIRGLWSRSFRDWDDPRPSLKREKKCVLWKILWKIVRFFSEFVKENLLKYLNFLNFQVVQRSQDLTGPRNKCHGWWKNLPQKQQQQQQQQLGQPQQSVVGWVEDDFPKWENRQDCSDDDGDQKFESARRPEQSGRTNPPKLMRSSEWNWGAKRASVDLFQCVRVSECGNKNGWKQKRKKSQHKN